ncbi:H/ACA ribonucleoprotein complex subunit 2-like protein [Cajanus cajan]|uniref:H/ACA ribonucleoprotein complex subunit 2 n=1 Tax=Cajanus cajan TaxID=3821 RepID=A0A151UDG1_CAJCA|nr:H/ACA ribonucleoprotein complex subunit 2-like protein [Cajanus cajan]
MGSDSEAEKSAQKEKEKKILALSPIAKPLAGKKLCKRTLKLVRRASQHKCLKRGVKEVVKSIRRGQKGLCVIAGNISPIDVITHVPILCEEADIPYIYVPSKEVPIHNSPSSFFCLFFTHFSCNQFNAINLSF